MVEMLANKPKEVKTWWVGQESPKQKINEETGWYSRNISPQAHTVIKSKKEKQSCGRHNEAVWQD